MKRKVIVSVINDLVTDQRVHKVCQTLINIGFDVVLVGRKMKSSPAMNERPYKYRRMKLVFEKGPLFYAEFNIRLFIFLLFKSSNLLVSNDLDTLLPNYLISKIKKLPLVYDSHEYFTEVPELVDRKIVQSIWKFIERSIFPKLKHVITVNDSIADLFEKDYGLRPLVVRNIPRKANNDLISTREKLGLPNDKNIIILQGSGINVDRGAEELVESMKFVENTLLLIIGGGDVIEYLKKLTISLGISDKILFKSRMPYEEMIQYTRVSDLGITFDKSTNINYKYSLPNKLFDYIHAGVPVLSSDLPETKKIIIKYNVGDYILDHDPESISDKLNNVLADKELMAKWKKNCSFAAQELTWENEEKTLKEIYSNYV